MQIMRADEQLGSSPFRSTLSWPKGIPDRKQHENVSRKSTRGTTADAICTVGRLDMMCIDEEAQRAKLRACMMYLYLSTKMY